jgi:hypothetical protein
MSKRERRSASLISQEKTKQILTPKRNSKERKHVSKEICLENKVDKCLEELNNLMKSLNIEKKIKDNDVVYLENMLDKLSIEKNRKKRKNRNENK